MITYQLESGKPAVVTHRVVAQGSDARGEALLQTRGDTSRAPDEMWVRPGQVKGELWYSVPLLGHVNNLLSAQGRQLAVHAVSALLLGYAALMLLSAARSRARSARPNAAADPAATSKGVVHA